MQSRGLNFKMEADMCAVDDILGLRVKSLLLLPKFSYSQIYQHSKDCSDIKIDDNRSKVCN